MTATDTEVGKTTTSAILCARYGPRHRLAYWKPVATGARDERDTERVEEWVGNLVDVLPETYLYDPPVSPHLAARLAGRPIELDTILGDLVAHALADEERNLVIEGIGGVLVPFDDRGTLFVDLMVAVQLPVLVVARSTLGTINHTLLTVEALRSRSLDIAGLVLVGPPNVENRRAVESRSGLEVVSEIPWLERLDRETIRAAATQFDPRARLEGYFRVE